MLYSSSVTYKWKFNFLIYFTYFAHHLNPPSIPQQPPVLFILF